MKTNWLITGLVVGAVILAIVILFPIVSENERVQNQIDKKNKLEELSKKGIVMYDLPEIGKNIVDYRINANDVSFNIESELEKKLRENQHLFTSAMTKPIFSDNSLDVPANRVTINLEWEAVEIGIEPEFLIEQSIPVYFEQIRSIIGNQTNIVLVPSYPATALEQSFVD